MEGQLAWDSAGKTIYVLVRAAGGSIEGPYQDVQGRVYAVGAASGTTQRLGSKFEGSWEDLTVSRDGCVYAVGLKGINRWIYELQGDGFKAVVETPGAYGRLSIADRGGAMLFTHSAIDEPTQVYLAAQPGSMNKPGAITPSTRSSRWYLSGAPWEKPELYESEAALFQMDKVKTPTHMVGGDVDNRVSFFEQIVFERALARLGVPHDLLQFPGENHPLGNNPWHGYIKVREELKWINQYAK